MATKSYSAVLSPVDQYMPRMSTPMVLVFETPDPERAINNLTIGLRRMNRHLSYLRGRVFEIAHGRLELRWTVYDEPVLPKLMPAELVTRFSAVTFQQLKDQRAPPHYFPASISPAPVFGDLKTAGMPAFAVNYAPLAAGGLVVCCSFHKNVVDCTGAVQILRLWAAFTSSPLLDKTRAAPDPDEPFRRGLILRLAMHRPVPNDEKAISTEEILARHPEIALAPSLAPEEHPFAKEVPVAGISTIFTLDVEKLEKTRVALRPTNGVAAQASVDTVVFAILWSCITRVRATRGRAEGGKTAAADSTTAAEPKLSISVDMRAHLDSTCFPPWGPRPFLGNVTKYNLTQVPLAKLESAAAGHANGELSALDETVAAITSSLAAENRESIVDIARLVEQAPNASVLRPGKSFGGLDLSVSSWANMGDPIYTWDWVGVGKVEFVRLVDNEWDGVLTVMPRKWEKAETGAEPGVIEVCVSLRKDDMETLRKDEALSSYFVEGLGTA
ncbi:uncharacterized protein C8A04DRAFT_29941 [Dichotomopilus funicola]|uniref:Uncharacterized protein n=1 Tax=Dichotomopilus funicola TaxID=1934379 RepID=A0AAN6ZMB5_9PEZI|nr:hypothetical protein C8A04DRAFT_29941 [Dichotomopilus funicola]